MNIIDSINKNCIQTAVYWAKPTNDGYGGGTFQTPTEIKCRWEEDLAIKVSFKGVQTDSATRVYVLQDVEQEGFLMLGSLSDVGPESPIELDQAYEIRKFSKIPRLFSSNEFLRTAYL